MERVSKRALNSSLKNCETKAARSNQWAGFQRANQWAGFQWAGFKWNGVVLLGAVLLSLLFVGNLQAQSSASTKQGFFAGIVYLQGFGVDTTKTSTNSATVYRIKYSNDITGIEANGVFTGLVGSGTEALLKANCERDATTVTQTDGDYSLIYDDLTSFSPGRRLTIDEINNGDATVILADNNVPNRIFHTGFANGETSYCYRYFSSGRTSIILSDPDVTADTPSKPVTSTESDALNGVGLQVGWRGEKWRASLTHFTGKGGANELVNTVVMAEYFFHEEFFAGGGLASMKLTNGSTSASATSPVLTVGYKENLTPNLFFNISLTKYISGISLSRSISPTATVNKTFTRPPQTKNGDSATIGLGSVQTPSSSLQIVADITSENILVTDNRIEVTQFRSRDVEIQEVTTPAAQKIEAEIKAPVVVSISLLWRF